MKKFIITSSIIIVSIVCFFYVTYFKGFYIDFNPSQEIVPLFRTEEEKILRKDENGQWEEFVIRGVEFISSKPSYYLTDYALEADEYFRWLELIQEMGANTVWVTTVMDDDFYEAFYEFNIQQEQPLYLLQGLQVSDTANYGAKDIYDREFYNLLKENGKSAVDVIHGQKYIPWGDVSGSGFYRWDVSEWVLGYLVGTEWDSGNIAFTNNSTDYPQSYEGEYFTTSAEASRFEAAIASIMDDIMRYESSKYKTQRLISFVNDQSNDPFDYTDLFDARYEKYNRIDAENILPTAKLESGYFASYSLSYVCDDLLQYLSDDEKVRLEDILIGIDRSDYYDGYLELLEGYHTMPIVAAGYGFSTSRVPTIEDFEPMNEQEQGEALVQVWQEATSAGWDGVFISTWQDVWDRRTWNTAHMTFDFKNPIWQDVQAEGQCYGLLELWLGEESENISYVDGDASEWDLEDVVTENGDYSLSMKYDEKYLYFMVEGIDANKDQIFIPIDTTPKSGSTYSENYHISFENDADFLIVIDGRNNSQVLVQERYEILWPMYAYELERENGYVDPPAKDSSLFKPISLLVSSQTPRPVDEWVPAVTEEIGNLRYGNANPDAAEYDSLGDFIFKDEYIEIRIPWQLLNFANPSEMMVHDDYYENYGVEYIHIDEMHVGIADSENAEYRIPMDSFALEGWGRNVTYHERLKESYYILKDYWASID